MVWKALITSSSTAQCNFVLIGRASTSCKNRTAYGFVEDSMKKDEYGRIGFGPESTSSSVSSCAAALAAASAARSNANSAAFIGSLKYEIINIMRVSIRMKRFASPIYLHFLFFDFIFFCLWILVLLEQVFSCFSLSFLKQKFNKSSQNILSEMWILYFVDSKWIWNLPSPLPLLL